MDKLKVFVGIEGKWVLCEYFKDTQENAGLHEMLEELINEWIEFDKPMGFYMMGLTYIHDYGNEDNPYLDIDTMEKVDVNLLED